MRIRILLTLLVLKIGWLKWSQCKHSKKGTVRRDWNDVDNRNGRDVLQKRQRRETEGAVFETRGTGKEDGLDVLRDVLLRLSSLSAYVHVRIRIYIRKLAHARPPMSSISLVGASLSEPNWVIHSGCAVCHIKYDRPDTVCIFNPRACAGGLFVVGLCVCLCVCVCVCLSVCL